MTGPPQLPCRRMDPEIWFPVSEADTPSNNATIATAKAWCAVCPLTDACLEWALDHGVEFGIWGGQTATERRVTLRRGYMRTKEIGDHRTRATLVRELASQA